MDANLTMNIHHAAVLLILLTWLATTLGGMRGEEACNYECHSDGSCSLQVATRQERLTREEERAQLAEDQDRDAGDKGTS